MKPDQNGERRYNQWAGNPRGTPEDPARCIKEVWPPGRYVGHHQCFRRRGYGPDRLWCRQHAPKDAPPASGEKV